MKMRKILSVILISVVCTNARADLGDVMTEEVDGIVWSYVYPGSGNSYSVVYDTDEVWVGFAGSSYAAAPVSAVPANTCGELKIPATLGGVPVRGISQGAFRNCRNITSVTIPPGVVGVGPAAFEGCKNLMSVTFLGDAPDCSTDTYSVDIFSGTPKRMVISVPYGSIGWNGGVTTPLPSMWHGRAIAHAGESYDWDGGSSAGHSSVSVVTTNVVVNYVLNSIQPEFALPPSSDTGFVTVITEVKGGVVAVPETWAVNYDGFAAKFGTDFTKALTMKTGKKDGVGNDMLVWQDYVAGTDPTKMEDRFTASITIDKDGKVHISYSPELDENRKRMRIYTVWGKKSLRDRDWVAVSEGDENEYNFYKVTVEMKGATSDVEEWRKVNPDSEVDDEFYGGSRKD